MHYQNLLRTYGGILFGSFYGLLMRIVFGLNFSEKFVDLFSITFVWILPILIGLAPLLVSRKEDLSKRSVLFLRPLSAVLSFFILCYWTGQEDILCILIIALPFLLIAGISGMIVGPLILRYRKKNGMSYSILILPLASGLLEPQIPTPTKQYESKSHIIIHSDKVNIWNHVVRVEDIEKFEYQKGIFHYAGIPRPLYAELNSDTLGGIRIGHFEGGLTFRERIVEWKKNQSVTFDIQIIPSKTNRTIFERHMLSGEHFKFLQATYNLNEITPNQIELSLSTQYQLNTKINYYGEFWGELLLSDFQERLLQVLKARCEKKEITQ